MSFGLIGKLTFWRKFLSNFFLKETIPAPVHLSENACTTLLIKVVGICHSPFTFPKGLANLFNKISVDKIAASSSVGRASPYLLISLAISVVTIVFPIKLYYIMFVIHINNTFKFSLFGFFTVV